MGPVRSVTVRLSANTSEYIAKMRGAAAATEASAAGMSRSLTRHSAEGQAALTKLETTAKRVGKWAGLSIAGGYILAAKSAADFAEKQALVNTLAHSTPRQAAQLAAAARSVGTAYGYTATQVSDAEAELIKAGISTKDMLSGALNGALTLAAAGQTDVAQATEYAAAAMTQFRLKGRDVPHIADLLAAGADKALGSVQDLGYGLSQVGTTAHQSGLDIDQTVGTLAAFAQAGLTGERGGTIFKQMLLQLQSPTKKASDLMAEYNLELYKSNGQMKSVPEIADALRSSFERLTPEQRNYALGVIFGSRAIQGANVLMAEGGKGIDAWIRKVNDQGFAAHQASGKLDSLKGDMQKLKAEGLNALIDLGDGSQAPLRKLVQNITHWLARARKSGDLKKWGNEATEVLQNIASLAGTLGRDLKPVASAVGAIITGFTKLPAGLQKILVAGAAVGYAGKKTGLLDLVTGGTAGKGAAGITGRAGVVPVFVTNEGFGGGVGGRGGAGTTAVGGGRSKWARFLGYGALAIPFAGAALQAGLDSQAADDAKIKALGQRYGVDTDSLSGFGNKFDAIKKAAEAEAARKRAIEQTKEQARQQKALNKLLQPGLVGDYGKALKSLPPKVQTKVTAPGADISMADVKKLAHQYDLTPKQVRTLIALTGADQAIAEVVTLRRQIGGLHGKTVTIKVVQHRTPLAGTSAVVTGAQVGGSADGSTVPKTGRPYADQHLYLLADGERVTSNRHGQVDKSPRTLDLINRGLLNDRILGLADGGNAGRRSTAWKSGARDAFDLAGGMSTKQFNHEIAQLTHTVRIHGGHLGAGFDALEKKAKKLEGRWDKSDKALQREIRQRDDLISQQDQLKSTVGDAFTRNPFEVSNPWLSSRDASKAGLGVFGTLEADTANAKRFKTLAQIVGRNIHGQALASIESQGVDALAQVAGWSTADQQRYEKEFNARAQAVAGAQKVAGQSLQPLIKAQNDVVAEQRKTRKELGARINHLEHAMEHAAGVAGKKFGQEIDKAHTTGARKGRG